MASVEASHSLSSVQIPVKKQAASSSANYLNRYVECDPVQNAASQTRKEKLWKIAAIASLVAFTILVAAAAVVTGIFFPAYLPVAIATAITLTPLMYQGYLSMQKWVKQHASEAKIEAGVAKKLENMPTDPAQVSLLLQKMGVNPENIKNKDRISSLAQLRPAIARFQYWNDMSVQWMESARIQGNKTHGVNQETVNNPEKIKETRLEALDFIEDSQIAKVRAAFLLHILRNPGLRGDENDNDLFSFKILPPSERLLRLQFQDPSHGILVKLKNEKKASLNIQDLIPLSVDEVYDKL